ncbi:MAG: helix-turn-helix domain-containing protein [Christensenellaceae bacterium]|jgi:transcriptional regulator with XRE-family HTH domain|nr:helix-turn-helix domain-containing protein [Christensenellaceae bacterium]
MEFNVNELVNRIAYLRNRANLSARKLSLRIGKAEGYCHKLESDKSFAPSFETMIEILEAVNSNFQELFYDNIADYKTDKELLTLLKSATPDRKQLAIDLLKVK